MQAEPIMDNLFNSSGEKSLHFRAKISPLFTPSKLKNMLPLLIQRSEIFKNWLDTLLLRNEQINCSELIEKLVANLSSVCLFGYNINSFQEEKIEILKCVEQFNKGNSWKYILKLVLPHIVMHNKLYDLIGYYLFDNAELMQTSTRFVKDIVNYRREHNIFKHDFVNILTEMKQIKKSTDKIGM